jgi:multidrug resistance efflux pump
MPVRNADELLEGVLRAVNGLRDFPGSETEFWPRLIETFAGLTGSNAGWVLLGSAAHPPPAGQLSAWPAGATLDSALLARLASRALSEGLDHQGPFLAVRLTTLAPELSAILILRHDDPPPGWPAQAVLYLRLFSDTPALYQRRRQGSHALAGALHTLAKLNRHEKFLAVSMALVNDLAAQLQCTRVSLGWSRGDYIRLCAVNNQERFEKKIDLVRAMETVMEESFDQDEDVIVPPAEGGVVSREHERFARQQGVDGVVSLPLRADEPAGVITLERHAPFTPAEIESVRLVADLAARRLQELRLHDRWIGSYLLMRMRKALSAVFGPRHTFTKLLSLAVAAVLAFMFLYPWPYRVEAPFSLHTRALTHLPSPFDGFIGEVRARMGDRVAKGDVLLVLDKKNLLISRDEADAERVRAERQAQLALAEGKLGEMRVAQAQAQQALAKLNLANLQLEFADVRAPMDGVVVEGDWEERIGSPIRKAEILFRIARLEDTYLRLKVKELDIHEVRDHARGRFAFASRPETGFHFEVELIHPAAVAEPEGNTYVVQARILDPSENWWRPGMTGIAKVDAGTRPPIWILSHRAIDYLRMKLWL